jgi:hypothetical protein
MENQLDLQTSELEKYEEFFNHLDKKLVESHEQFQVMTEEIHFSSSSKKVVS